MKYFIYTRKSTDSEEKQVLSIEAQLAELKEFAVKERLEIIDYFMESKTAKEPGRAIFAEMIDRIEKGEAQGILAWHPDRLARNSVDGGRIIYMLDTNKIQSLKFPTFWFESTPQGKFMLSMAFGQSKYYVDNLSENVKRGNRQKLRKGIWPGWAPLGYLNNVKTKEIDIDPKKAPFVKKVFELYATGDYPLKAISGLFEKAKIKSNTGKTVSVSNVQNIFQNPFYYGVLRYNGELYNGIHKPIISKKLFDSVQAVMSNRGKKGRKRKHYFAFSGLLHCGNCGCTITAEIQKGNNYYRCTKKKERCLEKFIREEALIEQIKEFIKKVTLPDDWTANMLNEIEKEKEQAKIETKNIVQNLIDKKIEIDQRINRLLDLFVDGKGINQEEYQTKKQKLLDEKLDIEQKINDFEQTGNNWLELCFER